MSHSCEVDYKAQTESNRITLYGESHLYKGKDEAHPDLVIVTSSPESTTGHMVRAKVNGQQVNFLLDTGSAVTLLRLDVWKQCCNMPDRLERWNGTRLVGVDSTPLTIIGIRKINFCFADTNFPHSVLAMEAHTF